MVCMRRKGTTRGLAEQGGPNLVERAALARAEARAQRAHAVPHDRERLRQRLAVQQARA
jgi:hypothetical protein